MTTIPNDWPMARDALKARECKRCGCGFLGPDWVAQCFACLPADMRAWMCPSWEQPGNAPQALEQE